MKSWIHKIVVMGSVILIGLFIMANGELAAKEKVLVIGEYGVVNNLDAATAGTGIMMHCGKNIYQGLLRYKHNSKEIEGDLAESWTVSKDQTVWTFKLHKDIQFPKGFGPVTARDVKFSYDRIVDPATNSLFRGELTSCIKEVKVIDDYTVEVTLKEPMPAFPHKLVRARPWGIVSQKAVEQRRKDFNRNPIGSGRFMVESMTTDEVVFVANKDYFEGPPKLDKVIYRTIPDQDTRVMAICKGDIDMMIYGAEDQKAIATMVAAGIKQHVADWGAYQYLYMSQELCPPFRDIRVRKAIAHAIDRDAIINYVLTGYEEKLNSLIPKGYFGYSVEGVPKYEYDLKKAKALLAQAGYPNGFEVTFDASNAPRYLSVATALQAQLTKLGLKVNLSLTDHTAWTKKVLDAKSQLGILLPAESPDASIPLTKFFHTAGFPPGYNMIKYNKLDKEINAANSEMNTNKRKQLYANIQKKLMEDLPAVPLFMIYYATPHNPKVTGLEDRSGFWGYYWWYIDIKE